MTANGSGLAAVLEAANSMLAVHLEIPGFRISIRFTLNGFDFLVCIFDMSSYKSLFLILEHSFFMS
jgi:hypothetical protein